MIVNILMIIFIIFLLGLSYNLWYYSDKKFLIYDPKNIASLKPTMRITAGLLCLDSIAGIIILFFGNVKSNLIILVAGAFIAGFFSIYLSNIRR
ncbi:hypothetical protein [Lactobacillus terrae]|uniref:hypothetical protein n=1 Tax=Lactobacillus terrae TaxID=2269374 RepID=UPI000C1B6DE7|nr:hypothetical protein [Lactobacillus terrae]